MTKKQTNKDKQTKPTTGCSLALGFSAVLWNGRLSSIGQTFVTGVNLAKETKKTVPPILTFSVLSHGYQNALSKLTTMEQQYRQLLTLDSEDGD